MAQPTEWARGEGPELDPRSSSGPEKAEKEDANSKRSFAASLDLTRDRAKRTLQMKMMPKIPSGTRQVNNQVGMIRTMEKESRAVKAEKVRKASPQAKKA